MDARTILIPILLIFVSTATVRAQDTIGSVEVRATLNQELIELESKEIQLRIRLEVLDEQLKPENIELAAAGVGSVHPEELREYRRRLLAIERDGIQKLLELLEQNRARIKAAIVAAEYAEYLTYALPATAAPETSPCKSIKEEAQTVIGTLQGAIVTIGPGTQSHKVPGAKLRLKGVAQEIEASSNDQGEYEFTGLSNGDYTLEVSAPGFKTLSKLVTIQAGEVLIENFTLEVGEQ